MVNGGWINICHLYACLCAYSFKTACEILEDIINMLGAD